MFRLRIAALSLFFWLPIGVHAAGVSAGDLPDGTLWYLHADLETMRTSDAGRGLYRWLDGEIFVEIRDEIGIDVNKEADRVTAFSSDAYGTVIVVEGKISDESRDKLLALATIKGGLDMLSHGKATYYHISDDNEDDEQRAGNGFDSLQRSAYFTFDVKDKLIVASTEDQLKELIDRRGRIAGFGKQTDALLVLATDKNFVQAGMRTGKLAGENFDWDSNILRNTEQAALLVSASGDLVAIEAQLVSSEPQMAQSLGGIVNGLISLQAFNSDMPANVAQVLANTKVKVVEKVLSVSTVLDPNLIVTMIDN